MNRSMVIDFLIFFYILIVFVLKHTKYKDHQLPLDTLWEIGVVAFILVWLLGR
ncbi:hypothetical protein OCC_13730 [Thermococcus litoralis DSM 5473]|uniref:TIGR00159 family protein n=1 Tax=Thermococcus litoralis (strain ATCC 51850 / DSM 5473 / JCM 8560 / NS-C) TaxID=523849 RepID=S5ZI95_THELN|nr:hypothetical protein OCC_13730 [Thermococcus litoralis DSM 5473]